MKFLDIDSPLMQTLGKLADFMWLNILTLVCCLPIVTVGASMTAMHYMAIKLVRNEEGYITKGFFSSFRKNFKQATLIWLLLLLIIGILATDYYIMTTSGLEFNMVIWVLIAVVGIFVLFTALYVFAVQAKFENTIPRTIKNAFLMSFLQLPKTVLMVICHAIPIFLLLFVYEAFPVVFMLGIAMPAWVTAKLNNKLFKRLEAQFTENNEEVDSEEDDDRIFRDQLDESLENSQDSHS